MFATIFKWLRGERGNTAAIMAILLVPIVGALSMSVEASSWFFMSRSAQNAADSAAVAAANNGVSVNNEYIYEGRANAAKYGFANGSNNVSVNISYPQPCPDGTNACYKATVTKIVPIYLTRVVGFNGDTALGSGRGKTITSIAYAEPLQAISFPTCLTAEGTDSASPYNGSQQVAIGGNGTPSSYAPGCSLSSVGGAPSSIQCTGSAGLGAPFGFATGTISGSGGHACVGESDTNSSFTFCDPYAATVPSGCTAGTIASAVASAVSSASSTPCTASGSLGASSASCTWSSGDFTLTSNLDPGASNPKVVVIGGGHNLFMGNFSSNNITYIFTGSPPGSLASSSNLNLTAPSTGSLSGIAAYQVMTTPCTHTTCDTWNDTGTYTIQATGLLYLPYTNAQFGGSTSQASTGHCLIGIFNSLEVNGTGYVLEQTGCNAAGLGTVPTVTRYRAALVR